MESQSVSPSLPKTQARKWLNDARLGVALIAACTILLYLRTLGFSFVWDDHTQVVSNPLIRSWHTIPRLFTTHLWSQTLAVGNYYRPSFLLWSTVMFKLGGISPAWWHLATVLLHAGATCLVYFLAQKLDIDQWGAAIAAAVFATHPVHVEVAAWVSAGSDSLVTILVIAAILLLVRAREPRMASTLRLRVASVAVAGLAMLTKEMGVVLPLLVFAYVMLYSTVSARFGRFLEAIRESIPYGLVAVAYVLLRKKALHGLALSTGAGFNWGDVLLTWPVVLANYIRLLVAPVRLNGYYHVPYVSRPGMVSFVLPLAGCITLALFLYWWSRRKSDPSVAFCGWWMLLCLVPVLYLPVFQSGDFVRDRYLYLSSVGFCILLGKAIRMLPMTGLQKPPAAQIAVAATLVVAMAAGSLYQQTFWANDSVLIERGYTLSPQNPKALSHYARLLVSRGDFERALRVLQTGIEREPDTPELRFILATTYARMGRKEDAFRELQRLQLNRGLVIPANDKTDLATLLGELGDFSGALQLYQEVLSQYPETFSAVYNCGITYYHLRQYSEAEPMLKRALAIDSSSAPAHMYLGISLLRMNRIDEAESHLARAVQLAPNEAGYHLMLGIALQSRGELRSAQRQYEEELRLNPGNPAARTLLSKLQSESIPERPENAPGSGKNLGVPVRGGK